MSYNPQTGQWEGDNAPKSAPKAYDEQTGQALEIDPLDHDADGKRGGSKKQDDIAALRKAYKDVFGKQPFNGWDAATLREKIEAA